MKLLPGRRRLCGLMLPRNGWPQLCAGRRGNASKQGCSESARCA
jgi:hypothetical protein